MKASTEKGKKRAATSKGSFSSGSGSSKTPAKTKLAASKGKKRAVVPKVGRPRIPCYWGNNKQGNLKRERTPNAKRHQQRSETTTSQKWAPCDAVGRTTHTVLCHKVVPHGQAICNVMLPMCMCYKFLSRLSCFFSC